VPLRKRTYHIPSGPPSAPSQTHLFIALIGPAGPDQELLLVNLSSIRSEIPYDPACLVAPGDHPFVTQPSFVYYRMALLMPTSELHRRIQAQEIRPDALVSEELYQRIVNGLFKSRMLKVKFLNFHKKFI